LIDEVTTIQRWIGWVDATLRQSEMAGALGQ
jgi:hypothetical protein